MTRRRRLRLRILVAFSGFAAVVALGFFLLADVAFHQGEDRVIERELEIESARIQRHLEATGQLPPTAPLFTAYLGAASCPGPLRARCAGFSPGAHEIDEVDGELWVARVALAGRAEPLFVVYQRADDTFGAWISIVFAGAVVIWIGGTVLGVWTARRVTAPLADLAAAVETTPPDRLADLLGERVLDQEVQVLADRLRVSVTELGEYARREQRFTRYASHELRSPVAVIRGAAELLAATPEVAEERVRRPLERIERAAADMEAIIESFLWLARGRVAGEPAPAPTPIEPIVERVLERHQHLLAGKPIKVEVARRWPLAVAAPPGVLEVAIGNLVANAFHFTETGSVTVEIDEAGVVVADTGPGLAPAELDRVARPFVRGDKSSGFGLGLDIVGSLCDRFGWRLSVEGGPGAGTRARLELMPCDREEA